MKRYHKCRQRRKVNVVWAKIGWTILSQMTLRRRWKRSMPHAGKSRAAGFSLLETLTVLMIIGILVAIAAGSWLSFLNTWRLNSGQDQVYQIMRMAQAKAKNERRRWQASFRNSNNQIQWAIHPTTVPVSELVWRSMSGSILIDSDETTLYQSRDNVYRLQFNHQGNVNGRLGRLTIKGLLPHKARRCVFASTLIGTLRKAKNQRRAVNGRYCY